MSTPNDKLSKKTTQVIKITAEPKVDFYVSSVDSDVLIKVDKEIVCPHCKEKSAVTRKVNIKAFDVVAQKFIEITLPEVQARAAFANAYNSLLNRIVRAWNVKGFWAKVKALRKTEILSLPDPTETVWTIVTTDDSVKVTAEVETK